MTDPAALLAEARRAWRAKLAAESQLGRLDRYARMSPSMRRDHSRHWSARAEADRTLNRILGSMADDADT